MPAMQAVALLASASHAMPTTVCCTLQGRSQVGQPMSLFADIIGAYVAYCLALGHCASLQ